MFADVTEAVAEIKAGRMVVVVDDEDRENEGDLTLAAEFVTPEAINFMAKFGRGLICLTLTEERADYLRLGPMTQENTSRFGTAFTESIEAREGVTTGISAADRAHTIKVAIDPRSTAHDLATPFFATEYDLSHMDLPAKLVGNVQFGYYPAGHMVYLNVEALKELKADMVKFYATAQQH